MTGSVLRPADAGDRKAQGVGPVAPGDVISGPLCLSTQPPGTATFILANETWAQTVVLSVNTGYVEALGLLMSLRQLLRAAEMAQTSLFRNKQARQILNNAVRQFKAAPPDLVDARDIIEHFDKYAVGQGDLQIKDRKGDPSLTDAQLAKRYEARLEGSFGEPIIRVGERAIEVTKVMGACTTLFERMRKATHAEDEGIPCR